MNEALKRIHMQVMWNRLIAVVEEQAQALLHTAFGAITREAGDLSAGVYDTGGGLPPPAGNGAPPPPQNTAAPPRPFPPPLPPPPPPPPPPLLHHRTPRPAPA